MHACTACGAVLPETARFCPACAAPVEAKPDERERKLATIVFADLVGSTELGGSQDPERTRALLERFYDAMAEEISTAGGTVEKFAGDAVMAVFGAPAALEDHAERALHAALAMQRRLRELFGETLALRIGVNTGEVVVGKPREGSSFVTGDSVNVTARLEQAAEAGDVLVGERTVATTRGAFEFGEPRTIEAKGKPEGVGCRRLVRALSLMRPRGVGGLSRAFVGRDEELGVLERVYEEVIEERQAQLVTILGDAGVGKTRLLREFWDRLGGRSPETLRRTGRCLSYGQGITYWPLGEVLKEHLGILDSDPPAFTLERLGSREILGLTLGLDVAQGLHPLAARDRFQDAWVEFLEQLPGWGARVRGTNVALEALSPEDAVRMLDELLGGTLPLGLGEIVVERAEGNPFFVEELLATLIDRQLLKRQNGAWRLAELPSDFAVPDTVQAVVAARIDLLDPAEKQALQAASVIGRIFWAGPVYELVQEAEPDLQVLEERDFIRRRAGSSIAGDREYAIKHALTRDVAYAGLPRARQRGCTPRLHGGSSGPARDATSTRPFSPTTTRRRSGRTMSIWRGEVKRTSSPRCEHGRSPGFAAQPSSRSAASRSTTALPCSAALSTSGRTRPNGLHCGGRSDAQTSPSSTARPSGPRCRGRWRAATGRPPPTPIASSLSTQRRALRCGSAGRTPS